MKSVTEAGFPSLAFFEMVAQIKPSADHVLVSLGGEEGRLEWRPYGGGGGFQATITFSWGIITVTSTYLNGETKSLYYFDDDHGGATNSVLPFDYYCTGQIWEFTVGTTSATVFNGIAAPHSGFPEPNFFYIRYLASYDSSTDNYHLSTTESLLNDETNQIIVNGSNTSGDFSFSSISSNQVFTRRTYNSFVLVTNNNIAFNPESLGADGYGDTAILGTRQLPPPSTLYYYLGYEYIEVQIQANQIEVMGSTPITLLPAPDAGFYYEFYQIILEKSDNGSDFLFSTYCKLYCSQQVALVHPTFLNKGGDKVMICKSFQNSSGETTLSPGETINYSDASDLATELELSTEDGTDSALVGSHTIIAKIWYRIRQFGAT